MKLNGRIYLIGFRIPWTKEKEEKDGCALVIFLAHWVDLPHFLLLLGNELHFSKMEIILMASGGFGLWLPFLLNGSSVN